MWLFLGQTGREQHAAAKAVYENKYQLGEDLGVSSLKACGPPHPSPGRAGSSGAMRTTPPPVTESALLPPKEQPAMDPYMESPLLPVPKTA